MTYSKALVKVWSGNPKKKNTIFKKFCSETEQCPVSKFLNNILELKIEQILEKNVMGHDCVLRVT